MVEHPSVGDGRSTGPLRRRPRYATVAWIALLLLAVFPIVAAGLDLLADARTGIPADHAGAFATITSSSWPAAQQAAPGVTRYVTVLERGYALHEATFGLLMPVLVAVPLRRGQRWAWWACWIGLLADPGYTVTFGVHDPTILTRALVADVLLPVALLSNVPYLFGRTRRPG